MILLYFIVDDDDNDYKYVDKSKVNDEEPKDEPANVLRINFPPFAMAVDKDNLVLIAGGGGASRTGVPNQLVSGACCCLCQIIPH